MKLYVGNLPFDTDETALRTHLEVAGRVLKLRMISDQDTGMFKGFAFADMENSQARDAIMALHGQPFGGRPLTVAEAKEKPERQRLRGSVDRPRGSRGDLP